MELRSGSTWNIYMRWVYIVTHDIIWVLFTEVCPSYVVRALVRLSKNLVEGTRRHSGYVDICPDLPSLVRLFTQICADFRMSSHQFLKPSHCSLRPMQRPHFIGPHWQHPDRSVLDNYLLDVPDARHCSVCNHDCLYLSIQKGNRTTIGPEDELVSRITSRLSLAKKSKSSEEHWIIQG